MEMLGTLYLHRYRIFLAPEEDLCLPEYKGATLRGVFGTALRRLACVVSGETCNRCALRLSCSYAFLFETSPPPSFRDAAKYSSFPRPYIINPPFSRQRVYQPGEPLLFEFSLIGSAADFLPHVILTFASIGENGLRNGKGKFTVTGVESVAADGSATTVYADGVLLGGGTATTFASDSAQAAEVGAVTLHFLTPTHLELKDQIQNSAPSFDLIVQSLARRVSLLAALYCGGGAPVEELPAALAVQASEVRILDADVSWQGHERFSSRQQVRLKQGGIVGSVTYYGPVSRFLPLLWAASRINVGKSTTFGLGRVAITF